MPGPIQRTHDARPLTYVGGRVVSILCAAALCLAAVPLVPAAGASGADDPKPFQPGVLIDWQHRAVIVESRVVLTSGQLEFLACFAGKEHESILRMEASADHICMALGLVGLEPGHPPVWNDAINDYDAPAGDLIDIECQWEQDGQLRSVNASDWLCEIEYARAPLARPWVFSGSLRARDNSLVADHTGVGVALVDFPDSLISLSRRHTGQQADLWAQARTAVIPPRGTAVRLIFRPAEPARHEVVVDFRGQTFVDGRFASLDDLADLIEIARRVEPQRVQLIRVQGALSADVARVRRELERLGVPAEAVRFHRDAAASRPVGDE